jgi:glycosyltransferase involved in cell wall biosynthesis
VPRLGFDATPLLDAKTGIGWYTHELVDAVARQSPEDEVVLFPISWRSARRRALDAPSRPNVRVVRRVAPARPLWGLWRRSRFPPLEWLVGCDVFHGTNYVCPPSLKVPTVVTVHDLGFVHHPEWVPAAVRRMARLLPTVLRRASAVVTGSNFTRDELAWWLPEVAGRTCVIPYGSRRLEATPSDPGIPPGRPYALMLGTLEPRKNVALALDAVSILRRQGRQLRLVLAGGASPLFDLAAALRDRDLGPSEVVQTGYLDDRRVAGLMAGARLLVFPSLYEGFGMPVVEAMASGVPVVAARAGATPEVAGEAACLVDPADAEAFAEAMWRVATDDSLRARMVAAGRRRAGELSWDEAAANSLRLYHRLAAG